MAGIDSKSFDQPDETRSPDKSRIDVVHLGDTEVGRFIFAPGWRWSECMKARGGRQLLPGRPCRIRRFGRLGVTHEGDSQLTPSPRSAYRIAPGHDAWVEGDEDFVGNEFKGASGFATA